MEAQFNLQLLTDETFRPISVERATPAFYLLSIHIKQVIAARSGATCLPSFSIVVIGDTFSSDITVRLQEVPDSKVASVQNTADSLEN